MSVDTLAVYAAAFGIEAHELRGPCRKRHLIRARYATCWVLRRRDKISYPMIGKFLDGRDHSTIINAIEQCEVFREYDTEYRAMTDALWKAAPATTSVQIETLVRLRNAAPKKVPARLTKRIKPKNEIAANDTDARMRLHGTLKLERALLRYKAS